MYGWEPPGARMCGGPLSFHASRQTPFALVALVALVSLGLGCVRGASDEGEGAGATLTAAKAKPVGPPAIHAARVMPAPILLNRPVSVEVEAEAAEADSLAFRYQWRVNGVSLEGQTGPTLDSSLLRRGDRVTVEVIPLAGIVQGRSFQSPDVIVANTPPVVTSVRLEPTGAHKGDRLRALVEAADADHDAIQYVYRWWRNQRLEQETEVSELDTDQLTRGDVIAVEVTPTDGTSRGKALASEPLVLANSPPRISSTPSLTINPEQYQYTVLATDPDGDFLNFTLEQGPPGMTIDRTTGQLRWHQPGVAKGVQRVRVVVEDGHQGEAFQEFDLSVTMAAANPVTGEK